MPTVAVALGRRQTFPPDKKEVKVILEFPQLSPFCWAFCLDLFFTLRHFMSHMTLLIVVKIAFLFKVSKCPLLAFFTAPFFVLDLIG